MVGAVPPGDELVVGGVEQLAAVAVVVGAVVVRRRHVQRGNSAGRPYSVPGGV